MAPEVLRTFAPRVRAGRSDSQIIAFKCLGKVTTDSERHGSERGSYTATTSSWRLLDFDGRGARLSFCPLSSGPVASGHVVTNPLNVHLG
nr:unnamed protein product [Callosobruchus analis]